MRRLVSENLGYALPGGPVLGITSFLVGASLFGTVPGVGCAVVVYGLGWTLAVRQSERETRSSTRRTRTTSERAGKES